MLQMWQGAEKAKRQLRDRSPKCLRHNYFLSEESVPITTGLGAGLAGAIAVVGKLGFWAGAGGAEGGAEDWGFAPVIGDGTSAGFGGTSLAVETGLAAGRGDATDGPVGGKGNFAAE